MRMKLDRKLCILLHGLDKLRSLVRNEKTCHILDTDGISTHLFDLLSHISPVLKCISITECIRKSYLSLTSTLDLLDLVCCINSSLKVTDII
ncbi:MAG: hypothetical protein BWY61_01326 [Firmicutes bacterium ADurb.Bin354]|nr:MAG: hypothetical protein BWY61_01326 [Firmicutes bacterium ADurb.Bin354]